MPRITILYLSDLHYDPAKSQDSKIVIRALVEKIDENMRDTVLAPDLIFFTGDLVYAGTNYDSFLEVHQEFVVPILKATSLSTERFFICPGNHDIDREIVRSEPWIESGLLSTLGSVEEINKFMDAVETVPERGEKPLQRLHNWSRYEKEHYPQLPIRQDAFLKTYSVSIEGITVGISCLNTAWRATGEGDRHEHGNLSMGERAVDHAISDLNNCKIKVALFHHPLEWLLADEQRILTRRIYSSFDGLFHGHLHVSQPEFRHNMFGKAVISEGGCVYENRRYFNGFQYVILDTDEETFTFEAFTYFDIKRAFDRAVNLPSDGKITFGYSEQHVHSRMRSVDAIMQRARSVIRAAASRHIALDHTDQEPHDIKEFFVCPPIVNEPIFVAGLQDKPRFAQLDDILSGSEDVVFAGTRECGKTTLAHYIAVRTSEGTTDRPRIPVLLDFAQLQVHSRQPISGRDLLRRSFTQYLSDLSDDVSFQERLAAGDFLFVADNVRLADDDRKRLYDALRVAGAGNRWILLTEVSTTAFHGRRYYVELFPGCDIYFIDTLPRRSIRELARRWCAPAQLDDREAFTRVMSQIASAELPRNAYIVSLLLWALVQKRQLERVNEAALLENLIEFILDKADFRGALRREFDFRSKTILLQEIALITRDRALREAKSASTVYERPHGIRHHVF